MRMIRIQLGLGCGTALELGLRIGLTTGLRIRLGHCKDTFGLYYKFEFALGFRLYFWALVKAANVIVIALES